MTLVKEVFNYVRSKVLLLCFLLLYALQSCSSVKNDLTIHSAQHTLALKIIVLVLIVLLLTTIVFVLTKKRQALKLKELVETKTKQLQDANANLEHINNSKNEILGIVAHDLRNPIGNINGFCQFIIEEDKEHDKLDEVTRKSLHIISDLSQYMLRLTNNLLDVSTIEAGVLKLNCISTDYIAFMLCEIEQNKAEAKKAEVELLFTSNVQQVYLKFDALKIQQVCSNLISNALKFSKAGDKISVLVEAKNDKVITTVKDAGPGIPEDKLDSIFRKFTQLDSSCPQHSKGAGLGLSIVKGIVEAHKGRVWVQSKLGEGAEFIYELPIRK